MSTVKPADICANMEDHMIDARILREQLDVVAEKIRQRRMTLDLNVFRDLDEKRRSVLARSEALRHRRNTVSDRIAELKKAREKADDLIAEMKEVSQEIKNLEKDLGEIEAGLGDFLMTVPNIPDQSVPVGADEKDNPVYRTWGEKPVFDFEPQAHWDLGPRLALLDFERGRQDHRRPFHALPGRGGTVGAGHLSISCWTCTPTITDTRKYSRRSSSTARA